MKRGKRYINGGGYSALNETSDRVDMFKNFQLGLGGIQR